MLPKYDIQDIIQYLDDIRNHYFEISHLRAVLFTLENQAESNAPEIKDIKQKIKHLQDEAGIAVIYLAELSGRICPDKGFMTVLNKKKGKDLEKAIDALCKELLLI